MVKNGVDLNGPLKGLYLDHDGPGPLHCWPSFTLFIVTPAAFRHCQGSLMFQIAFLGQLAEGHSPAAIPDLRQYFSLYLFGDGGCWLPSRPRTPLLSAGTWRRGYSTYPDNQIAIKLGGILESLFWLQ
ncbi:hypothetical protein SAY86_026905 [Trapa natans]|uniref:Uncharacterized protein n=1 Tax=Trapa natans TaxID=22666 RepID=A0AAN7QLK1_TRANT|nr:hypothetical protein SAY86_026905 [Trapa natans]